MRILLTNDDGIHAPGLYALWQELSRQHEVTVVAPDRERSAVSHSITLDKPLRIDEQRINGAIFHAVTGKPADCVKLGLKLLFKKPPDLVISGINRGSNTGINVIYSGTVAAAAEGMVSGIPSMAVSLCSFQAKDFTPAAIYIARIADEVASRPFPRWSILNVNIPNLPLDQIKGVKRTRMGKARFEEYFIQREDTKKRNYYWMDGEEVILQEDTQYDDASVQAGWISITPLKYDLTDDVLLEELHNWKIDREKS
jgi:5'-nucleotidase